MRKQNLKDVKNPILCNEKIAENKTQEVNAHSILTNNEINELGIKLIKQHLDKPQSFQLDNLNKNKITNKRFKIKYLLTKIKE